MSSKSVRRSTALANNIHLRRMALLGEAISWVKAQQIENVQTWHEADIRLESTMIALGVIKNDDVITEIVNTLGRGDGPHGPVIVVLIGV